MILACAFQCSVEDSFEQNAKLQLTDYLLPRESGLTDKRGFYAVDHLFMRMHAMQSDFGSVYDLCESRYVDQMILRYLQYEKHFLKVTKQVLKLLPTLHIDNIQQVFEIMSSY